MTWYSFKVRGRYPSGSTATMTGHIAVEGGDYPAAAFDQAVKTCQRMTPGLIVETAKPNQVVLQKLKRKPKQ